MPVTVTRPSAPAAASFDALRDELAAELRTPRPFGQPTINEEPLPNARHFSAVVFWDKWEGTAEEDRPAVITSAYESAQPERAPLLAYGLGFTIRQAAASGLLPYAVEWVRLLPGGRITADLIRVFTELGGSPLRGAAGPLVIRCQTMEEAERYQAELIRRLPEAADAVGVTTYGRTAY